MLECSAIWVHPAYSDKDPLALDVDVGNREFVGERHFGLLCEYQGGEQRKELLVYQ